MFLPDKKYCLEFFAALLETANPKIRIIKVKEKTIIQSKKDIISITIKKKNIPLHI